jgi:hypothetical protein
VLPRFFDARAAQSLRPGAAAAGTRRLSLLMSAAAPSSGPRVVWTRDVSVAVRPEVGPGPDSDVVVLAVGRPGRARVLALGCHASRRAPGAGRRREHFKFVGSLITVTVT